MASHNHIRRVRVIVDDFDRDTQTSHRVTTQSFVFGRTTFDKLNSEIAAFKASSVVEAWLDANITNPHVPKSQPVMTPDQIKWFERWFEQESKDADPNHMLQLITRMIGRAWAIQIADEQKSLEETLEQYPGGEEGDDEQPD